MGTARGMWDERNNQIEIRRDLPVNVATSVLLHEVQHAIQKTEGFARGGVATEFKEHDDASTKYAKLAGEIEARDVQARQHFSSSSRR